MMKIHMHERIQLKTKRLSVKNSINPSPLRYGSFLVALALFISCGAARTVWATSPDYTVTTSSGAIPPTLGNYPDTSIPLSTDTTVTPDAPPTNTTSINVSTSTNFKGKLDGDPATGVVRVTNAHPAGTYTVTVTAFNGGAATATKTFRLRVTTPVTCTPVSFAAATNFGAGTNPMSVAVGDFNGDGKQDLAIANTDSNNAMHPTNKMRNSQPFLGLREEGLNRVGNRPLT